MNTKNVAFAIMMGALGNVLFIISQGVGQIAEGIALDLSLIGVFIAGFYGGPITGLITGLIAGILPGIMFGPLGTGGVIGLIGLPLGKALTGLTTGLLTNGLKLHQKTHQSLKAVPVTLMAYIPEGIFTYAYFSFLLPFFLGGILPSAVIFTILLKAVVEVVVMSVIMAALVGNTGFKNFVTAYFTKKKNKE